MSNKLYVGNLPYTMTDDQLEDIFSGIGRVAKVRVIMDRTTGRSKGFGFVEMDNETLAGEAIDKLNGFETNGRKLKISIAREPSRSPREEPMIDYR